MPHSVFDAQDLLTGLVNRRDHHVTKATREKFLGLCDLAFRIDDSLPLRNDTPETAMFRKALAHAPLDVTKRRAAEGSRVHITALTEKPLTATQVRVALCRAYLKLIWQADRPLSYEGIQHPMTPKIREAICKLMLEDPLLSRKTSEISTVLEARLLSISFNWIANNIKKLRVCQNKNCLENTKYFITSKVSSKYCCPPCSIEAEKNRLLKVGVRRGKQAAGLTNRGPRAEGREKISRLQTERWKLKREERRIVLEKREAQILAKFIGEGLAV